MGSDAVRAAMGREVEVALADELGSAVVEARRLSGGDIAAAFEVVLADGRRLFVKRPRGGAEPDDVEALQAEARGLRWLAEAGTLAIPEVLAAGRDVPFLALRCIRRGAPGPDYDDQLGRGLAGLHRFGAPSFGLDHDNRIGTLPQCNDPRPDWPSFYREQRLEPQLRRAIKHRRLETTVVRRFEQLYSRLEGLCGPAEPPSRLHGDLWAGNAMPDAEGTPVVFDPAPYGGHREVDLAMMRLFGGFGSRCFDAYAEVWPLAPGWQERVDLYQLYPLLVHVNLFGGGYVAELLGRLERLR